MDATTPVNWESLDALVVDFARSENLIDDLPAVSSYQSRLINRQVRRSLEAGDVDAAIELLRSHAPSILEDRRIVFRLQKQKLIELLRRGKPEDRHAAIDCLRTSLAPCALDAYPEAYEEFKHILLAFIYDKEDHNSPVANEWSEKKRFEIAGLMSSVLRAHLHAYDPVFSMTLRYLISIHKEYCSRQGVSSPISDLNERLFLRERDPPATLQESFYEAPPFDEVDIQALAHAVELTRQGAIDSLRFAKGDLFVAFQNELCRTRLDFPMLDDLVREYCVYRGIVDSCLTNRAEIPIASEPSKVDQAEGLSSLSRDCSLEVESDTTRSFEGEIVSTPKDFGCDNDGDVAKVNNSDAEQQCACETAVNQEICSTSASHQSNIISPPQKSRYRRVEERGKRKRWRERSDDLSYAPGVFCDGSSKSELFPSCSSGGTDMSTEQESSGKKLALVKFGEGKYDFVLEMKELASQGMVAEVVEEVNSMDPDFFKQNPLLLFQLKQVQFLNLVNSGDHAGALRVACSHLGPLATNDPSLLKPLKETLLALIQPTEQMLHRGLALDALSTSLQVAIGRRLGIEEPQLMKIMRATLHSHTEWFKLQMCKDRFESLLKIDALKDVTSPMLAAASAKSNVDSCTHASSVVTTLSSGRAGEDSSSPMQVSSTDAFYDESAILKVMEFLALPRADAIHLLAQYNGNAETVIEQLFA